MTVNDLYTKISDAYSNQNLNRISVTLINLYKEKQFGTLRQIAEMISDSIDITIDPEGKYFSKLMMLYHPDRGDYHRNEINRLAKENNYDGLLTYSHILLLNKVEEIAGALANCEDIDYSPVYEWDVNLEGFSIIDTVTGKRDPQKSFHERSTGCTFFEAVEYRMLGNTSTGFPPYYLQDLDEFELSQSGINDLDGIQYCIHAVTIDLSGNAISDLSLLWGLTQLEELNLSDNHIEEIESLVNLRNLRTLNLSNNSIKDISYLIHLPNLEYVALEGNKISSTQINRLEEAGVTVVM